MNHNVDRLDSAIDHVAKRLVAMPGNEAELSQQIIDALPDRTSRLRWLIPQFVALGAIVIAAFTWTMRDRSEPAAVVSSSALAPLSPLARSMTNPNMLSRTEPLEPLEPLEPGTQPLEPLEPMEPLEPLAADFERSLSPLAPMSALSVSDVSLSAIAVPSSIELAPIEISELPMSADIPPRQQE